jgi:hypothetical protein
MAGPLRNHEQWERRFVGPRLSALPLCGESEDLRNPLRPTLPIRLVRGDGDRPDWYADYMMRKQVDREFPR